VAVPVLGIDVGGVLVDRVAEGSDTSFFGANPMATPAVPGAFDAVAKLCSEDFGYRVHIVSKAGPKIAGLTREWLGRTGFFEQTGVSPSNVWFVRKRIDKAPICARLGITHFVDDRLDVLEHLTTVEHRYLFLGGLGQHPAPKHVPPRFRTADSWPLLARLVAASD
jgi:hypothetical protein